VAPPVRQEAYLLRPRYRAIFERGQSLIDPGLEMRKPSEQFALQHQVYIVARRAYPTLAIVDPLVVT